MFLVFMRLFWSTEPQFLCRNKGFLYDNEWIKYSMKLDKIFWAKIADSRHLFTQTWKKHLRETRNCFIFKVDQLGLEPRTSRLWVGKNDISWVFVLIKVYWHSIIYIFELFIETLRIPLTQIVCLRIVYAEKR